MDLRARSPTTSPPARTATPPRVADVKGWLLEHLDDHYRLYGEFAGVRSARKHIGWTLRGLPGGEAFRAEMNAIESCDAQARAVGAWFDRLADSDAAHAACRRTAAQKPISLLH